MRKPGFAEAEEQSPVGLSKHGERGIDKRHDVVAKVCLVPHLRIRVIVHIPRPAHERQVPRRSCCRCPASPMIVRLQVHHRTRCLLPVPLGVRRLRGREPLTKMKNRRAATRGCLLGQLDKVKACCRSEPVCVDVRCRRPHTTQVRRRKKELIVVSRRRNDQIRRIALIDLIR